MDLTPPMEDYLEAVFLLCRDGGVARVKQVASHLSVSTPSVVKAVRALKERGLIDQERYGYLKLTPEGERIAAEIMARHEFLVTFLEQVLGVDATAAVQDACRIEHVVSPDTLSRLRALAAFLLHGGHPDLRWREEFEAFCARERT